MRIIPRLQIQKNFLSIYGKGSSNFENISGYGVELYVEKGQVLV